MYLNMLTLTRIFVNLASSGAWNLHVAVSDNMKYLGILGITFNLLRPGDAYMRQ